MTGAAINDKEVGRGWQVVGLGQGAELVARRQVCGVNGGCTGVTSSLQLCGHMMSVREPRVQRGEFHANA